MTSQTDPDSASSSTGLEIEIGRASGATIVRVAGALRFPAAIHLTSATKDACEQGLTEVTVLDLSGVVDVDHTGVAVLVAVRRDLKAAGSQVRIVRANDAIMSRLPYTLGLRRVFANTGDALSCDV